MGKTGSIKRGALGCALFAWLCLGNAHAVPRTPPRQPVKVLIVSMFGPESKTWLDHLGTGAFDRFRHDHLTDQQRSIAAHYLGAEREHLLLLSLIHI